MMRNWKVILMVLGVVTVSSESLDIIDIMVHDKNNDQMIRWDANGDVLWMGTDVTHNAYRFEMSDGRGNT